MHNPISQDKQICQTMGICKFQSQFGEVGVSGFFILYGS